MKNRFIISIFTILLCFAINGCKKGFLNENALGVLTPDNYFKNEAEANLAINGLHANAISLSGIGSLGTDICVSGRDPIAPGFTLYNYAGDPTHPSVVRQWTNGYAAVKDANFDIDAIAKSSLSDAIKQKTTAEALFYRAYFYFQLTLQFGDVPYWRDALDIDKVSRLGTTSAAIIQQEMISDLDIAISSGKLSTLAWKSNTGRPSIWAARMLKATLCMWLKQWPLAKAELVAITTAPSPYATSGPAATAALSDDYARMYRQGNELDNEVIFGRQYLANVLNSTNHATYHFNSAENAATKTAMAAVGVWTSSAAQTIRKSYANTYPAGDKRKKYNVWDTYTNTTAPFAVVTFNWIYVPKMMRSKLPLSDPLMTTADPVGISSQTDHIFILSDAYLLLAEAEFMINGSSIAALAAINKIRSVPRTGLTPYTTITLKDIQNERGWELTVDGFFGRKYDLVRWGILESTAAATATAEIAAGAYVLSVTRANDEAAIIAGAPLGKYRFYPIPNDDIVRSQNIGGALVQNPLWK